MTNARNDAPGFIGVEEIIDGKAHRRIISVGSFVNGEWVPTDLSNEPSEVQALAAEVWTPEVIEAFKERFPWVEPPPPASPVLEPYQFFAMLEISGMRDTLNAYIDGLGGTATIVARSKLNHTNAFHRDNGLVLAAQSALGLTDEQLDTLWAQAAAIE